MKIEWRFVPTTIVFPLQERSSATARPHCRNVVDLGSGGYNGEPPSAYDSVQLGLPAGSARRPYKPGIVTAIPVADL